MPRWMFGINLSLSLLMVETGLAQQGPKDGELLPSERTIVIDGHRMTVVPSLPTGRAPLGLPTWTGRGNASLPNTVNRPSTAASDGLKIVGVFVDMWGSSNQRGLAHAKALEIAQTIFNEQPERTGVGVEINLYKLPSDRHSAFHPVKYEAQMILGNTSEEVIYNYVFGKRLTVDRGEAIQGGLLIYERNGNISNISRDQIEKEIEKYSNPYSGDLLASEMAGRVSRDRAYAVSQESLSERAKQLRTSGKTDEANEAEKQKSAAREAHQRELQDRKKRDEDSRRMQELGEKSAKGKTTKDEQDELDDLFERAKKRGSTARPGPDIDGPVVDCPVCADNRIAFLRSPAFLGNYRFQIGNAGEDIKIYSYGSDRPVSVLRGGFPAMSAGLRPGEFFNQYNASATFSPQTHR